MLFYAKALHQPYNPVEESLSVDENFDLGKYLTLQYQPTEIDIYSDVLSQLERDSITAESKLLEAQAKRDARLRNQKRTDRQYQRDKARRAQFKIRREALRRRAIKQGKYFCTFIFFQR